MLASFFKNSLPLLVKLLAKFGIGQIFQPFAWQDYDIQSGKSVLASAKTFPNQTFEAIAFHREAQMFLGNNQT